MTISVIAFDEKADILRKSTYGEMTIINGVSVPSDFPQINIEVLEETAPGKIFITNQGSTSYLMILENDGTPFFYKRMEHAVWDFKLHPTGTFTRFDGVAYVEMNEAFNDIDTLMCSSGLILDSHEIQLLPGGEYIVLAQDHRIIDMSEVVEGGNPQANVRGLLLQRLNRSGDVLFEWSTWEHFEIRDAIHEDLTAPFINYVHINSVAVDYDGHYVISSRNLSEVTKINSQTGEIIWRLGGENNQFEFVNDGFGLSYQHDIRPVPNKPNYYTIFDNGRYHIPQFSRAVEFQLDTINMTATKIWEYRSIPDRYSRKKGNVQRLSNGNTLINWAIPGLPKATEVSADGELLYEMDFVDQLETYRTFRFEWDGMSEVPYLIAESYTDKISLIFNKFGDPDVEKYIIYGGEDSQSLTSIDTTENTWLNLTDLNNHSTYYFQITALDGAGEESGFSNQEEVFIKYVEPGENIVLNGDFSINDDFWDLEISDSVSVAYDVIQGEYRVSIFLSGSEFEDIQFAQAGIQLIKGNKYLLEFDCYTENNRIIEVMLEQASPPYEIYSSIGFIHLTSQSQHHRFEVEMEHTTDLDTRLVFNIGGSTEDFYIDNVSLKDISISPIKHDDKDSPQTYQLYNNYPNPFNANTIINYELPITSDVDLNVYNILGQKVTTLISKRQKAGFYQVRWEARDFASGLYYYRLETSTGFLQTKKLILMK
jgi:hypothetical protein